MNNLHTRKKQTKNFKNRRENHNHLFLLKYIQEEKVKKGKFPVDESTSLGRKRDAICLG